eukprot:SAG11_NODE_3734_length_2258_cov_1.141732_3_plen_131_part_00
MPPGSKFTYDSEEYIQHISYALSAVVPNNSALAYAREHFAVPLGMDDFFDYDNVQVRSQRQRARVVAARPRAAEELGALLLHPARGRRSSRTREGRSRSRRVGGKWSPAGRWHVSVSWCSIAANGLMPCV